MQKKPKNKKTHTHRVIIMTSVAKSTVYEQIFISLQHLGHSLTMCTFLSGDTLTGFLYLGHREIISVYIQYGWLNKSKKLLPTLGMYA